MPAKKPQARAYKVAPGAKTAPGSATLSQVQDMLSMTAGAVREGAKASVVLSFIEATQATLAEYALSQAQGVSQIIGATVDAVFDELHGRY